MLRKLLDNVEQKILSSKKLKKFYPLHDALDTFLYTTNKKTEHAPYVRDAIDLKRTMILVVFTVGGLCEALFAVIRRHEINEGFIVTGFLIPLTMPPTIPLWMLALATIFGVVIGKEIFGGTGYNIFNPALTARAFLFFSYPAYMSGNKPWIAPLDGLSQATPLLERSSYSLGNNKLEIIKYYQDYNWGDMLCGKNLEGILSYNWSEMFYGFVPGSIGETSALAILIGAVILLITGIASWRTIFATFIGMFLTSTLLILIAPIINSPVPMLSISPFYHLVMGGFAFGMVFMATDPVSSAQTNKGRWMYGLLIGFMATVIRCINPAYPEGMMLAILFANAFAPLFDYSIVQSHIKKRQLSYEE